MINMESFSYTAQPLDHSKGSLWKMTLKMQPQISCIMHDGEPSVNILKLMVKTILPWTYNVKEYFLLDTFYKAPKFVND